MRHQAREHQHPPERRSEPHRQHREPEQTGDEAGDEPDQHGVLRVGEDDRRVQRGHGTGHHPLGDALEGRHQLAEDGADAEQDHRDGDTEAQPLGDAFHQIVADVDSRTGSGVVGERRERGLLPGPVQVDQRDHQIHQHHRQRGRDHRIPKEA